MATYVNYGEMYAISNRPRIMLRFLTAYIKEKWDNYDNNPLLERTNCKESQESNFYDDGGLTKNIGTIWFHALFLDAHVCKGS
jgi:hypothetical protein